MSKKIIIVDDDSGICNSLTILFRDEGYSVHETSSSAVAENLIKKNKYDVCLFDYKMKGLNGLDLLKLAKELNPQCSVFIISGMLNIDELCDKEMKSGLLAGVISKPFDVEALLQKIASID